MLSRERRLRDWVGRKLLAPAKWSVTSGPFVSHLIGTDRAFGVWFPEFFLPRGAYHQAFAEQIAQTHLAARIALIADDALRDGDYSCYSRTAVQRLLTEAISLYRQCLRDTGVSGRRCESIIRRHKRRTERAYSLPPPSPPQLAHTCERCSWFYAAFDACEEHSTPAELNAAKKCFTLALYLLQLADDFADYDRDATSGNPYNVLVLGKDGNHIRRKGKRWIMGYTIYAISRLSQGILTQSAADSPIHNWAKCILELITAPPDIAGRLAQSLVTRLDHRGAFVPPVSCTVERRLPFADVQFATLNGVVLNAESVNAYASLRALAASSVPGFCSYKEASR